MTIFNYILDNNTIFYSLFAVTGGLLGYKLVTSILETQYIDKNIQTDAWENYSDRPSQILETSSIITDTQTPVFYPVEQINEGIQVNSEVTEIGIQTSLGSSSTATTVLPIPPVEVLMVPNIDLIDLLESPIDSILPLDTETIHMSDNWDINWEWNAEDLIKIASFFN